MTGDSSWWHNWEQMSDEDAAERTKAELEQFRRSCFAGALILLGFAICLLLIVVIV